MSDISLPLIYIVREKVSGGVLLSDGSNIRIETAWP
jgi:hypothetical protein